MVTAHLVYGHHTGSGGSPRYYAQSPRSGAGTPYGPGAPTFNSTKRQAVTQPTQQPQGQPSPHTARGCNLCGFLRHPAQAAQGRALTAHLAAHPFPQQGAGQ